MGLPGGYTGSGAALAVSEGHLQRRDGRSVESIGGPRRRSMSASTVSLAEQLMREIIIDA
ncbi:hypothetical protein N9089_04055 [Crocinitomicaceae bacterium]|nr:hypothetical protein [Crocinitomicaceae bacterium]